MCSTTNKSLMIRKSNALIEASFKLTISEQRLLIVLASSISPDDEDFKDYTITVSEFAQMFELELNSNLYDTLQNAALSLMKQQLRFTDDSVIEVVQWLSYIKYVKGSGIVKLRFDKSLTPHLLQLKERFTQYRLNSIVRLSGQYSVRLYELLKAESFKAKKGKFERFFQIDDLRSILGVNPSAYSVFNDFKLYVINPSVNEISLSSDLVINEVRYGKTGRKITNVTFLVEVRSKDETRLRQANLLSDGIQPEKESENHPIIDSLVSLGFSLEIAKKYKNKHGIKKIERNIAYTLAKNQERSISDVPSYLNKAIENDYGLAWEIKRKKEAEEKQQSVAAEKSKKDDDARKRKESKEKHETALAGFYALSQDAQDGIKKDFLESIQDNTFVLKEWAKIERANENPIERPMIKSMFVQFLINKN